MKTKKKVKTPKTLLRLRVPKQNESGPMAFEQILASLHGIISQKTKQVEAQPISFEIAQIKGEIFFYVSVSSQLQTLIASQFYAQYPTVEIEAVPEYFIKNLIKNK